MSGAVGAGAQAAYNAMLGVKVKKATPKRLPFDRWRKDPLAWAVERLGVKENTLRWSLNPGYDNHHWDGTADPIARIMEALADGKDCAVESGTGTGKTFLAAILVLWFLDCFSPAKVITTAPREKQLTSHMWAEIALLWPKFHAIRPKAKLTKLRIEMEPATSTTPANKHWIAEGVVAGVGADESSAVKMQGFHSPHMFWIMEEMPGMNGAITTAIEYTCTGDHNIRLGLGNPDHQQDALHLLGQEPGVVQIRISSLDHPNVVSKDSAIVSGAVAQSFITKLSKKYGEDARLYKSRIRGISPAESKDSLISWAWCKEAVHREGLEEDDDLWALGVDVANSENGDRASIACGLGARLLWVKSYQCPDANAFGREKVLPIIKGSQHVDTYVDANRVGLDTVGVGVGAYNELVRLGVTVRGLSGAAKMVRIAGMEEMFPNLRSQMLWLMREDLRCGRISLPDDEELFQDLTTPKWEPKNGKIHVESKKDFRSGLGRSPDKGDAAVYWNFVRQHRSAATIGGRLITL